MSILFALTLVMFVTVVASRGFDYAVPGWLVLILYFGFYAAVQRLRRRFIREDAQDEPLPKEVIWPISGPISRYGSLGLAAVWSLTNALALLNPRQLWQVTRQLTGNLQLSMRARRSSDGGKYRCVGRYTLPFRGRWAVINGGTTPRTSHSWQILGQRYALDFVQVDPAWRRHRGRGTHPQDYFCYGAEIIAATDGEVVATEDRVRLGPGLGWGVCDFTARTFIGNHVVIRHAPGEFALYAHLIEDSVCVRPGMVVSRGQLLGRCGHTGHSSEPHLHFHLQDSPDLYHGMGLPLQFVEIDVNGEQRDLGILRSGHLVQNRAG